jgi:subtilisin family serine protease
LSIVNKTVIGIMSLAAGLSIGVAAVAAPTGTTGQLVGINVVLKDDITADRIKTLETFGRVRDRFEAIDALTMQAREADLAVIRSLPFVAAANTDAERGIGPQNALLATEFGADGINTWNLDAINVTNFGRAGRTIAQDGTGTYVAVLDTGLLSSWRAYFPAERIATQYARAFGGGGGNLGWVSEQPHKWQQDQDSHGTHVTSTIIGYRYSSAATGLISVNGVAPGATIIPVKVLNQNGSGSSSTIVRGIMYVAELKRTELAAHPVIINMSLGGGGLDAIEQVAIDYAIRQGVIVVASAGNTGPDGAMGYPGAYPPVISSAASGYIGQFPAGVTSWWRRVDVPEGSAAAHSYIANFSSREQPGQDLDVAAPGSWVVGPYQTNGQLSFFYLSGTSMASPHVAGIVALMAQARPGLTAAQAEAALERAATPIAPGCAVVNDDEEQCWGANATGAGIITADAAVDAAMN